MDDRRQSLVELRDRLREAIDMASMEMLPQLAGQYRATLAEIDQIDAAAGGGGIQDDLRDRRIKRHQARKVG